VLPGGVLNDADASWSKRREKGTAQILERNIRLAQAEEVEKNIHRL